MWRAWDWGRRLGRECGRGEEGWVESMGVCEKVGVESVGVGKKAGGVFEIHLAGKTSKILARDSLPVMWSAPCQILLTEDFALLWIWGRLPFSILAFSFPFLNPCVGWLKHQKSNPGA